MKVFRASRRRDWAIAVHRQRRQHRCGHRSAARYRPCAGSRRRCPRHPRAGNPHPGQRLRDRRARAVSDRGRRGYVAVPEGEDLGYSARKVSTATPSSPGRSCCGSFTRPATRSITSATNCATSRDCRRRVHRRLAVVRQHRSHRPCRRCGNGGADSRAVPLRPAPCG